MGNFSFQIRILKGYLLPFRFVFSGKMWTTKGMLLTLKYTANMQEREELYAWETGRICSSRIK